jgi:hypothetical protein
MAGTGRFNAGLGVVITAQGIGASLSTMVAEFVAGRAGYSAAFLTLAAIAGAGLALFWIAVPETWRLDPEPSADSKLREDKFLPASQ